MPRLGGSVSGIRAITYTGPGDIVSSARGWWGLRAYSNAVIGSNVVRLRRSSDSAEQNFTTLSTGALDEASITSFAGGSNLFVVTLFDQSGNAKDCTQSSASAQPPFIRNAIGSKSAIEPVGASVTRLESTSTISFNSPFSTMFVGHEDSGMTSSPAYAMINTTAAIAAGGNGLSTPNRAQITQGSNLIQNTAADNTWHAFLGVFNADTTSKVFVDGSTTTGDAGSSGALGSLTMALCGYSGGFIWDDFLVEFGMWPGSFSAGNITSLDSNAETYWGY